MNARSRHKGFTLLELLVAMSIVAVLVAMLFLGVRSFTNSSRTRATHVTLQSLRAMFDEYRAAAGFPTVSGTIDAPGDVKHDPSDFPKSMRRRDVVALTRSAMARFTALTVNSQAMGKVPDSLKFNEASTFSTAASVWTAPLPAGTLYNPLTLVKYPAAADPTYVCFSQHNSDATNSPGTLRSVWFKADAADLAKPCLKDAWDNPIIFVPGGLANVVVNGVLTTITAPEGKPFWASAGADGIFGFFDANSNGIYDSGDTAGGDDNVYSFESR